MRTRLLRVDGEPAVFAPLLEALGRRCGWLDLSTAVEPPAELEVAARLGVLRAVAAVGERAVAVKPVAGGFVVRDLVREHFAGCELVLVRGEVEAASLAPAADGRWTLRTPAGDVRELTTDQLARRLRRPSWPA